ncbi:PEP/pyruvate-binding domain-containing protein [Desulfatirhabdium butyrativorans]|uniref:PEP/pyruvate-binding domain-containing protein n=1 Tax=Desulfatirhabdium butyrativorans TaxID=340467 RepID=UPI00040C952A|nr:PEP/pyruvate-binding domain-containing protein [Desulfatirhabdium butyrativorans]
MNVLHRLKSWFSFGKATPAYPFAALFKKFQNILKANNDALELIADMGAKLSGDYVFDRQYILSSSAELSDQVYRLIVDLNTLTSRKYLELFNRYERIHQSIEEELAGKWILPQGDAVIAYEAMGQGLHELVGNKNANLADVKNVLYLPTPDGFAITTSAFRIFLEQNGLYQMIQQRLQQYADEAELQEAQTPQSIESIAEEIQDAIRNGQIPESLQREIADAVRALQQSKRSSGLFFAVRSSAWGEDAEYSFAGQYQTLLNVASDRLLDAYRSVLASAYNPSALVYRSRKGFQQHEVAMAVGCQLMIEAVASGVLYTMDPSADERDVAVVSATWGLGAPLVEGMVAVDTYTIDRQPPFQLRSMHVVRKPTMLMLSPDGGTETRPVSPELENKGCLSSVQLQRLVEMGMLIERFFKRPQDIEWALDADGKFFILQTRPLKIRPDSGGPTLDIAEIAKRHPVRMQDRGIVVQRGVATGRVFLLEDPDDLEGVPHACILVTHHTSPRLARVMRRIHGIITDVGSQTGHMATIAREFRIPCVVNTGMATRIFKTGEEITLDATQNAVYEGRVEELLYYEFTEEDVFEETYEYRLLRRLLKRISPLNLVDPHESNFRPADCKTYHDIIRFVHEKAVEEIVDLENSRVGSSGQARELVMDIPLGLCVIDIGGGVRPQADEKRIGRRDIVSVPMNAFLDGLETSGMWDSEPVSVDFGSFMSSMTRTMSPALSDPRNAGRNLAVITDAYFNLSLKLGYHYNIIDAYVSDQVNDNTAYFRFLGGVTDMTRRSRRAGFIGEVLERFNFRVEIRGDLVIGRIKKCPRKIMEQKLWMLGSLVAYTRQLDVQMHEDADMEKHKQSFCQRILARLQEESQSNSLQPITHNP